MFAAIAAGQLQNQGIFHEDADLLSGARSLRLLAANAIESNWLDDSYLPAASCTLETIYRTEFNVGPEELARRVRTAEYWGGDTERLILELALQTPICVFVVDADHRLISLPPSATQFPPGSPPPSTFCTLVTPTMIFCVPSTQLPPVPPAQTFLPMPMLSVPRV